MTQDTLTEREQGPQDAATCHRTGRRQDWYFVFGEYHAYPPGYHLVIFGSYDEARADMYRLYGDRWAGQFPSAMSAGVVEWSATEVGCVVARRAGGGA